MPFPPDFAWGTATASYQIEGAVDEDGRGPSIWDTFSHTPGKVANGDTGDVACDHYHRWRRRRRADGARTASTPTASAWPGRGSSPTARRRRTRRGIDFYGAWSTRCSRRASGRASTLYHWDLPQALQDDGGGWQNRDTVERFAEYAAIVYDGARRRRRVVDHAQRAVGASACGRPPRWARTRPGLRDLGAELRAAHHLLLSHGLAVEAYRAAGLTAPIGITLNLYPTTRQPRPMRTAPRPALPTATEPLVSSTRLPGAATRPTCWSGLLTRARARLGPRRRPRAHRAADRLPRRQLLRPQVVRAPSRR